MTSPRVVVVAPEIPYEGRRNAGSVYVRHHVAELSRRCTIELIAPCETSKRLRDPGLADTFFHAVPVPPKNRLPDRVRRYSRYLASGLGPGPKIMDAFLKDTCFWQSLRLADAIELHHTNLLPLLRQAREVGITTPASVICHDVVTQGLARRVRWAESPRYRLEAAAIGIRARRQEPAWLNLASLVSVFKQGDVEFLTRRGVDRQFFVLDPYVEIPDAPTASPPEPCVLFVGDMSRPENSQAAAWLIRDIWPRIRAAMPLASLVIAGAAPSRRLIQASAYPITVTGAVPDLDPYYRRASVAITPLVMGAGLKFKVAQALAYGLPVVATSVGAEGFEDVPGVVVAPARAEALAAATVSLLADSDHRCALSLRARTYAKEQWNFERATSRYYQQLLEACAISADRRLPQPPCGHPAAL